MSLGRMREHILIQKKTVTSDGQGGHVVKWVEFADCPAEIKEFSLLQRARFQTLQIDVTHSISIRHLDGLEDSMRVFIVTDESAEPEMLDIVSIGDKLKRERFMTIIAKLHRIKQGPRKNA